MEKPKTVTVSDLLFKHKDVLSQADHDTIVRMVENGFAVTVGIHDGEVKRMNFDKEDRATLHIHRSTFERAGDDSGCGYIKKG